jgi:hypothetical protein
MAKLQGQQQELAVAANLHLVILATLALFGVFIAGLGYAQWSTRGIPVYRQRDRT